MALFYQRNLFPSVTFSQKKRRDRIKTQFACTDDLCYSKHGKGAGECPAGGKAGLGNLLDYKTITANALGNSGTVRIIEDVKDTR